MSREFGIYPDNCTPRQWWGARAILNNDCFSLLPDRINYERDESVEDIDKENMFYWMSHEMDITLQNAVRDGAFKCSQNNFVLESQCDHFRCEASTKNSASGYLYIGCWEV